ncbi:hypothetical protein [Jannaschia pohangensis]|uniref:EF hand n=1 Tax=Jannaschia pohangensis TaxID=390807 RepID=A0A1I3IFY5_9RHOB|nr:hypothetical protein [Jannaschia pohangensis]SFI46904.1 EF hand [Jannaschia pohangensis]
MIGRGLVIAALACAAPARAEDIDPADIVLTTQLERTIAALETPQAVVEHLTDLMVRIGRPDGIVLTTLTKDREAATQSRIAQAVRDLMETDANGDGALTRLEVSRGLRDWTATNLERFFGEFDMDGTGRITLAEVEEGVRLRALEVGSTALLEDLGNWDLNRDGIVTPEEIAAVAQVHHIPKGTLG